MLSPALEASPGLAAVRSWCGWHVGPSKTETIQVEAVGGRVLVLPSLHVAEVVAIRDEDGDEVTGWKSRQNGIVRGCWRAEHLYEVDLIHGYNEFPIELLSIVDRLSVDGLDRVPTSVTRGPFSESYGSADLESQPLTTRVIIGRYKLPPRP